MKIFKNQIIELIKGEAFNEFLISTNSNFFNIKQELIIRNDLVQSLNSSSKQLKAFAEYPRENNKKVDLSIIDHRTGTIEYQIEIKFQYPKDVIIWHSFDSTIDNILNQRSFNGKKIDLLILVISEWNNDEYVKYCNKVCVKSTLTKYQKTKKDWISTLENDLQTREFDVERFDIQISSPIMTNYYFYLIEKKVSAQHCI